MSLRTLRTLLLIGLCLAGAVIVAYEGPSGASAESRPPKTERLLRISHSRTPKAPRSSWPVIRAGWCCSTFGLPGVARAKVEIP
jgi:hypothetical protein